MPEQLTRNERIALATWRARGPAPSAMLRALGVRTSMATASRLAERGLVDCDLEAWTPGVFDLTDEGRRLAEELDLVLDELQLQRLDRAVAVVGGPASWRSSRSA